MKWEYLTLSEDETLERLNELGAQGWELVAFVPRAGMLTNLGIFKRAVQA